MRGETLKSGWQSVSEKWYWWGDEQERKKERKTTCEDLELFFVFWVWKLTIETFLFTWVHLWALLTSCFPSNWKGIKSVQISDLVTLFLKKKRTIFKIVYPSPRTYGEAKTLSELIDFFGNGPFRVTFSILVCLFFCYISISGTCVFSIRCASFLLWGTYLYFFYPIYVLLLYLHLRYTCLPFPIQWMPFLLLYLRYICQRFSIKLIFFHCALSPTQVHVFTFSMQMCAFLLLGISHPRYTCLPFFPSNVCLFFYYISILPLCFWEVQCMSFLLLYLILGTRVYIFPYYVSFLLLYVHLACVFLRRSSVYLTSTFSSRCVSFLF